MRHHGFRLRTILNVIATLAILMGLCQVIERSAPAILPDDRKVGITSYGLTVLARHIPGTGPQSIEEYEYEVIPLELIVIAVFLFVLLIILAASYLFRRSKRAERRRNRDAERES